MSARSVIYQVSLKKKTKGGKVSLSHARARTLVIPNVCAKNAHINTTAAATATATTTFISGAHAQGKLRLKAAQDMPTKGAHGWDYFTTTSGDNLLVMPNYYGCGSARGPTPPDAACRSTAVYSWRDGERETGWEGVMCV